jgi:3,4-dihydroxy 2-butanone 4-phosphate synthase/GTP cyclohydrolase II
MGTPRRLTAFQTQTAPLPSLCTPTSLTDFSLVMPSPTPVSATTCSSRAIESGFDSVEAAIAAIAAGQPVIVTDDEDRENEGDLIIAAEKATVASINMMILHARGLICVPMTSEHLARLGIGEMVPKNRESFKTAFAVSVDAAQNISTGISAADRTHTVKLLADPATTADDLVQPGHIFPLAARSGGVLERAGHTEAAVDLAVLAGLKPCAVICEILKEDGSMARVPDLIEFKKRFNCPLVSIEQLIEYRHRTELLVEKISTEFVATAWGDFDFHTFRERLTGRQHYVLALGQLDEQPTLVRVHRMNLVSDVFRQLGSDGASIIERSLRQIRAEGRGALVYLQHDPIRPLPALKAETNLEDKKARPVSTDFREAGIGAQILASLGLKKIRLLSSRHRKVIGLDGFGLDIVEQVPICAK